MSTKLKIAIGVVSGILLIAVGFFVFKALTKKVSKTTQLNYWGYVDDEENIKTLIDAYKEKHPNVSIIYKKIEETPEEYEKIVTDFLASGEGPDIFQIRNDWLPKHYKKLAEIPSSVYTRESFGDTFFEVAKNDLNYKDKFYAVPFTVDTLALFYNPKILNEKFLFQIPDTWDGFIGAEKKLRTVNGDVVERAGVAMGTSNNVEHAQDILYLLMLQSNTKMISNDFAKAYFNLSTKDDKGNIVYPGTNSLDFYTSFADPAKETYTWNASMPNSLEAFVSGKTAMYFGYASDVKKIKKATNEKMDFKITVVPQVLGNKVTFAKYWANVVSKDSKNQKTAWDFLKFASSKEQLAKYIKVSKLPSSRKDLASEKQEGDELLKTFAKQAKDAKTWYKGNWQKTDKIFKDLIADVIINKQPAQAALDSAAKKVTDILEEYKAR